MPLLTPGAFGAPAGDPRVVAFANLVHRMPGLVLHWNLPGNGSTTKLSTPGAFNPPSRWTVSCWFYITSLAQNRGVIGWWSGGSGPVIWVDNNGEPRLELHVNGSDLDSGIQPKEGWMHLSMAYDGAGTCSIYANGFIKNSGALTPSPSGAPLITHDYVGGPAPISAYINDVTVFNRVLTAAEIRQMYLVGLNKYA